MADKDRITYEDSDQEDAFLVHSNSGIIKFERTPDGLYVYKPTANFKNQVAELKKTKIMPLHGNGGRQVSNIITTVQENAKGYTQRQFENAKRARRPSTILLPDAPQLRISSIFCDIRTSSRIVQ
jgi:hypothetical protein